MENDKIRIAITHGDTNGIGYETIFKTFSDPTMLELCTPIIYGSPKIASYHRKTLGLQTNFTIISNAEEANDNRLNILTTFNDEVKIDIGTPTKASAKAAQVALDRALADFDKNLFDVLVTAPVDEEERQEGTETPSITKHIERATCHDGKSLKIYVNDGLRIASVTDDIPLGDALRELRKDLIIDKGTTFFNSLKRDFRLFSPRIALLQVNPQAGAEEEEILKPAIAEMHNEGVGIYGPYPADEFFSQMNHSHFDGVLAMYYNQAMMPLRLLAEEGRLTFTAGLPIVHTAPGTTPCFDIAGKGMADESTLRNAIYLAIDAFRHRAEYDEPMADPLKKLYHEKRDDSEKVRFAIPKKHEPQP